MYLPILSLRQAAGKNEDFLFGRDVLDQGALGRNPVLPEVRDESLQVGRASDDLLIKNRNPRLEVLLEKVLLVLLVVVDIRFEASEFYLVPFFHPTSPP